MTEKTKATEVEVTATEEREEKTVNKMVVRALFLGAVKSSKSGKIGVTFLIIDGVDEKGQIQVSSSNRVINKQQVTLWPVIQSWSPEKDKDTVRYAEFEKYLDYGGLREVYIVVSGKPGFEQFHGEMSKSDFEMYQRLVGKF